MKKKIEKFITQKDKERKLKEKKYYQRNKDWINAENKQNQIKRKLGEL